MTPPADPTRSASDTGSAARAIAALQSDPAPSVGDVPTATDLPPRDPPTVDGPPVRDLPTVDGPPGRVPPHIDAPPGFVAERVLGEGGMGVVYLARQMGLNRPVALKLVKGGQAVDAKALIRFLAEAEAVAAVRHPNVVEVYQYGDHAGKPYMALEYCPGGDLTTLVSREAMTSAQKDAAWFRKIADLMAKIADGVNAAHAQGIVHRDLKPHNVLLTADDTPKVADFGLAKRGVGSDLTNTQAVMGTPAYMAPEQAGGGTKFVGPEADVWALGVILYELCCGERPIDTSGPVMVALARVVRAEVSPLRTIAPVVPSDLALIAHKCLAKDPRDRYPTAGGLAADLRNWLDGKPISARPAGVVESAVKWAKRNKRLAGMGLAVFVTMGVATAVSLWWATKAAKAEADTAHQLEQTRRLEQEKGETVEQLKAALVVSRRKTALNYLAYGQMCRTASRIANAKSQADSRILQGDFGYISPNVLAVADEDIQHAYWEFNSAATEWQSGPPPEELKRKSLALARVCRQAWLVEVERDLPDLAAETRRIAYSRVKSYASHLAKVTESDAISKSDGVSTRRAIWEFYWGELCIVESPGVETAMVKLGKVMTKWEADGRRPPELDAAVADLIAACDKK